MARTETASKKERGSNELSARWISGQESAVHATEASKYFARVRGRLYKDPAYAGKYVGIRDRRLVGVDADKFALHRHLLQQFPDHRFIVMPVGPEFPSIDLPHGN